jgi:hypothetical protein
VIIIRQGKGGKRREVPIRRDLAHCSAVTSSAVVTVAISASSTTPALWANSVMGSRRMAPRRIQAVSKHQRAAVPVLLSP